MTALDTLRQKVEEAKANLPIALVDRPKAEGPLDALLAAHRTLVVAELANTPETEKMWDDGVLDMHDLLSAGIRRDQPLYLANVEAAMGAILPRFTAPLAAKLAQIEAERDAFLRYGDDHARKARAAEARVASLEAALGSLLGFFGSDPNWETGDGESFTPTIDAARVTLRGGSV